MPGKKKTATSSGSADRTNKPYLLKKDKEEVLALISTINKQIHNGDQWMYDNCQHFNGKNHKTAFVKWLQEEYPATAECRADCNDRDITEEQVRNWIQAIRIRIKKVNERFKDIPGFKTIPEFEYLQDGALTEEEKKAQKRQRELERLEADASFLRDLVG